MTHSCKYAIGRISRGQARACASCGAYKGWAISSARIDKIFTYRGLMREEVDSAIAGDIVALTGITDAHIGIQLPIKMLQKLCQP